MVFVTCVYVVCALCVHGVCEFVTCVCLVCMWWVCPVCVNVPCSSLLCVCYFRCASIVFSTSVVMNDLFVLFDFIYGKPNK